MGTGDACDHVDMATRDLDRLAKYVKAHRLEAYPSRMAAAEAAGVSKDTWQRVEEGLPVREKTYAKICRALGWAADSWITVAEGGEPVLAEETKRDGAAAAAAAAIPASALRRAAFEAARAKLPMAPIGDVDAFAEELVEVLRRAGAVSDDS